MAKRGNLIVLEGGCDATLQAMLQRLYRWMRGQGKAVEQTAEPTYGPVGAQIRLLQQGRLQIDPIGFALLGVADRMDHLGREDGICSWLDAGRHVLCARYLLFSYASLRHRFDLDWLQRINARCRVPDLTLFLDTVPADPAAQQLRRQSLALVELLQHEGQHIVVVDGKQGGDQVFAACRQHIVALVGEGADDR